MHAETLDMTITALRTKGRQLRHESDQAYAEAKRLERALEAAGIVRVKRTDKEAKPSTEPETHAHA